MSLPIGEEFDCPLAAELRGQGLPFAAVRALDAMGVPRGLLGALCGAGDLVLAQVDLHAGGLFSFGGPDRRLVMAVRDHGELVDLIALSSASPDEWALRLGVAEFLGFEHVARAQAGTVRTLRLHGTPLAWLRAGGEGACVLDWTASTLATLRGLGEGVTIETDPGAAERLRAMLQHGGLPQVRAVQPVRRVA